MATKKYKALVVITHKGHNRYCGPALKRGEKETFNGGPVWRGVQFDLDHLSDDDIAKLVGMGAVALVGAGDKNMPDLVDEMVNAGEIERPKATTAAKEK